jgi:hypothetical protein
MEFSQTCFAQERPSFVSAAASSPTFDGYSWEQLEELKLVLLAGFIQGYNHGQLKGIQNVSRIGFGGIGKFKDLLCANPESPECDKYKLIAQQSALELLDLGRQLAHKKGETVQNLIKDVDSFYQTFPLCRRRNLFSTLSDLREVWDGEKSYKEIGDECLKGPNK